ncbi:hypothetical protein CDAR_253081 [Caerostris darwini]|uniref:Uncharacterized protein n=1 Tax=Caerostris darwini TaxID=1538125 RepID=A0AAV4RAU8_9ARAC|nr:hypothetical protein CDAR_253081 [Caerostris darwini]
MFQRFDPRTSPPLSPDLINLWSGKSSDVPSLLFSLTNKSAKTFHASRMRDRNADTDHSYALLGLNRKLKGERFDLLLLNRSTLVLMPGLDLGCYLSSVSRHYSNLIFLLKLSLQYRPLEDVAFQKFVT